MNILELNLERDSLIRGLPKEIIDDINILKYKANEVVSLDAISTGYVWRVLEGSIKVKYFTFLDQEVHGEFLKGEWFGGANVVVDIDGSVDIETIQDSTLLAFPLKKMIEQYPNQMNGVWEAVALEIANEYKKILACTVAKLVLSNEGFFIKYLLDNDGYLKFKNLNELSELLNLNIRTLYRIISKLKNKKLILKERTSISTPNFKDLYLYYSKHYNNK